MSAPINAERLRLELNLRAMTACELAKEAKLSAATISHALNGHSISPTTLRRICRVLAREHVVEGARDLLLGGGSEAA